MAFADEIKAIFQTTSALSNTGITKLFNNLGKKYIMPDFDYKSDDIAAKENYLKKKKEENEGTQKKGAKGVQLNNSNNKNGKDGKPKSSCC